MSEIIRGGLMAVDPGQMEAGRSLGLNYMTTMVVIIIPQAIRAVLPALGNEFIVLLKDTSLITVIGGKELLYAAQGIMNRTYDAMFPLLGVAAIYLVLVMLLTWLLGKFERRLAQSTANTHEKILEVRGLTKTYGGGKKGRKAAHPHPGRAQGHRHRHLPRRRGVSDRPLRLRQVHLPALPEPAGDPHLRLHQV